ncbi:MAG: MFS transporter [Pseudochelatococcus sp.]|uniref:MFS transporter n=1 Tax=Pseudochelatococcus sp. TaxID=2020869 RepID=UPI003D8CE9E5
MTEIPEAAAPPLRRNRNYHTVLSSSIFTGFSNGVFAVALPWLATMLTRDPVKIAMVSASVRLPWLLFTLPAGVWTDQADRRRLIAQADMVRALLSLAIMALALNMGAGGDGTIWLLCLFGVVFGAAEVVRENAALTIVPSIVSRADLERANGYMWSASQISGQFIGPPVAGVLIGLGIAVPFGFDAASFAVSAGLMWLLTLPPRRRPRRTTFLHALREGLHWLWNSRQLLKLAIAVGVLNFFFMANFTVLVLYSQEVLGLSAFGHGMLMTAAATGGILGALLAGAVQHQLGLHGSMVASLGGTVLAYGALAGTSSVWIAAPALCFEMFNRLIWSVVTVSYRQRQIPDAILGRINSLYRFLAWGTMPLGALAGGWLVARFDEPLGRETALHIPYLVSTAAVAGLAFYCARALKLK